MSDSGRRDALLAQILDLEPAMHRAMGPARARDWVDVDLTMSQLKVLFVLHSSVVPGGEPGTSALRVSEVARLLGVTLPTVTAVMDKLVERGLVRRDEDPADRRQTLCRLTPPGQQTIERLMAGHRAYTETLLHYLSEDELAVVLRSMRLLIGAAERFRAVAQPPRSRVARDEASEGDRTRDPRLGTLDV